MESLFLLNSILEPKSLGYQPQFHRMPKRSAHIILLVFCFLLGGVQLLGQQGYVTRIKQLDQNAGLVGRRSTAALQDSDGFMWIATVDALNRYDGFSFKPFNQKNSKLNYRELNGGKLFEDEQGYLWLRYFDNVEFLHHRTFEVLTFEERFGEVGFTPDAIKYVHPNQQGDVLIYLKNGTKYLYRQGHIKPLEFPGTNWPWIEKEVVVHYDTESRELTLYDFDGRLKHRQTIAATPFHIDEA
ncbi:MAG: hypothetical protein KDC44_25020, partial [Phaeodactylibacter sp.]|nr:hypothetical protein [Phaeodactylibacter sp.]